MTNQTRNEVLLEGIPVGAPEPSHENHGQLFYRQILEVPRLSGTADRLPLLVRQMQLLHMLLRFRPNRNGFRPFGRVFAGRVDFFRYPHYTTAIKIKQVLNY